MKGKAMNGPVEPDILQLAIDKAGYYISMLSQWLKT